MMKRQLRVFLMNRLADLLRRQPGAALLLMDDWLPLTDDDADGAPQQLFTSELLENPQTGCVCCILYKPRGQLQGLLQADQIFSPNVKEPVVAALQAAQVPSVNNGP